jgi:hypothetical protein
VQYVTEDSFFTFPLALVPSDLGAISDEYGESFHQNISTTEERYAGKSSQNMLADYCWNLTEVVSIARYKRKNYIKKF